MIRFKLKYSYPRALVCIILAITECSLVMKDTVLPLAKCWSASVENDCKVTAPYPNLKPDVCQVQHSAPYKGALDACTVI